MTSRIFVGVEVALGRGLAAEGVGLVGQADVERVAVELGVHGDGRDAELPAGPDDPDGDLAPVGDQDLGEHAICLRGCRRVVPFADAGGGGHDEAAACGERGRCARRHRFADVRWVAETGSTNADVLALGRDGAPEGIVLVADHQSAGRGRRDRTWEAPPRRSLLVSVLLRPPARVAGARRWRRRWRWSRPSSGSPA